MPALDPIMELCRDRGCPVLIHTNEPVGHKYPGKSPMTLQQIFNLAERYRDNSIVLAHWGGGIFFFNLMKKEVREGLQNIHFDTAASPFLYEPEVYSLAVQLAGLDKILFGSDYPLIEPKRYFDEISATGLSSSQQAVIRGENAARLLKM